MKTYIISEIGINHNGDLELAKELIKISKDSGCDAVKFQKRDIESVYSAEELNSHRESSILPTKLTKNSLFMVCYRI